MIGLVKRIYFALRCFFSTARYPADIAQAFETLYRGFIGQTIEVGDAKVVVGAARILVTRGQQCLTICYLDGDFVCDFSANEGKTWERKFSRRHRLVVGELDWVRLLGVAEAAPVVTGLAPQPSTNLGPNQIEEAWL